MLYTLTSEFTQIGVRTGTIQNSSNRSIECSDRRSPGTGVVLKPGERFSFTNTTLYARCEGIVATVRVVPFVMGAGGAVTISGGTDTSGDSSAAWNYQGDPTQEMWDDTTPDAFDDEFDQVLDNIYGLDTP